MYIKKSLFGKRCSRCEIMFSEEYPEMNGICGECREELVGGLKIADSSITGSTTWNIEEDNTEFDRKRRHSVKDKIRYIRIKENGRNNRK